MVPILLVQIYISNMRFWGTWYDINF